MNALMKLYLSINWPLIFIIVYAIFLVMLVMRSNQKLKKMMLKMQEYPDDPQKELDKINEYIKKRPLSLMNSTLRLVCIMLLLKVEKRDELRKCVKKIRSVDIHQNMADQFLVVLFLLKEYGYHEEYEILKTNAEKGYKPFRNVLYSLLIQEHVDIACLPKNVAVVFSDPVRAVIAYYRGENDFRQGNKERAAEQFAFALKIMPYLTSVLEKKGYAQ